MTTCYARFNQYTDEWQPLEDHLRGCAELAADFAVPVCGSEWAFAAGTVHDMGKSCEPFQAKLREAAEKGESRKQVDHSTAGAQFLYKKYGAEYGKMLAYITAGHHAGLPNGRDISDACLESRLKKILPELYRDFSIAELPSVLPPPLFLCAAGKNRPGFSVSLFIRLLYSCLVDADFLDTERFLSPEVFAARKGYMPLSGMDKKLTAFFRKMDSKSISSVINSMRTDIRMQCLAASTEKPGLFSLTVPTGGGKTLSSLAFAIKHALAHGLERVIYVIPYTSIIEQTAGIFKSIFGEAQVLEHHSNFDFERNISDGSDESLPDRAKLACENWDAPIIVTTNVQFFESCFAHRSSRCRKLHNIARSVVILDEAQMLPVPFLFPTLECIRQMSGSYGTTFVLCTATQPALSVTEEFAQGLEGVREIISDHCSLYTAFRRAEPVLRGELSDEVLCKELLTYRQALCIVNTRRHAHNLFNRLQKECTEDSGLIHLSAVMCPVHRRGRINEIKSRLQKNLPCRVISTSLVEAGVDIDFPVVYRCLAGLDSIIQAGGRCNREGKLTDADGRPVLGKVYVFESTDEPPARQFIQNIQAAEAVFRQHTDLFSPPAVEDYFRELFWIKGKGLDKKGILMLLEEDVRHFNFPFADVARDYRIIENDYMESLIIPFDEKAELLVRELYGDGPPGPVLRKLQPYSIQISRQLFYELKQAGFADMIRDLWPVLSEFGMKNNVYRETTGLASGTPEFAETESCIW